MFVVVVDLLHFPELKNYDLSTLKLAGSSCPEEITRRAIAHLSIKDFTEQYNNDSSVPH